MIDDVQNFTSLDIVALFDDISANKAGCKKACMKKKVSTTNLVGRHM